jgi:hypothetical protein
MGQGYTRNDTGNNIADGNIINASDLDGEFDAVESAFNESTGHTHDGTAAEGAPITVLGPVQDFIASATEIKPKTTNTLDIGTVSLQFKDMYLDGTAYIDGLGEDILVATDKKVQFRDTALFINSSADGQLDIDADVELELVAPTVDIDASTAVTIDTATLTVTGSANVVGDLDVDNININGNTISSTDTNGNITLAPNGTGVVALSSTDLTFGNNDKAIFGAGSDLEIYHDGADSIITEQGTGSLYLGADSTIALTNAAVTQNKAQFITGGAVNLFYNNALKLATTATGVDVTGTVTADGLTVDVSGGQITTETNGFIKSKQNLNSASAGGRLILSSNAGDLCEFFGFQDTTGSDAGGVRIRTNDGSSLKYRSRFDSNGDISFYDDTGVTQGFYWDASTQNLGLGVTNPSTTLHVKGGTNENVMIVDATGTAANYIFDVRDDGTSKFRVDPSGNVGIGTSPSDILHIKDTSSTNVIIDAPTDNASLTLQCGSSDAGAEGAFIQFIQNTTAKWQLGMNTDNTFRLYNYNTLSEAMQINTTGDLLVGGTNRYPADNNVEGHSITAVGQLQSSVSGFAPFIGNRKSSDGDIAVFKKDGTTVGSIGASAANELIISSQWTDMYSGSGVALGPFNADDATADLGSSSGRFKDLYLSGGVYLGGTGSANYLDDYEEGTTLVTATPSTSGTITLDTGIDRLFYTKVGRVVTLVGLLQPSAVSSPVGTYVTISPLPFTASSTFYSRASNTMAYRASGSSTYTDYANAAVFESGTSMFIYTDASTWSNSPISQLQINISYITD